MADEVVHRLREVCSALPEVVERLNHGEPSWAVRRKTLVTFSERKACGPGGLLVPGPTGRPGGAGRERARAILPSAFGRQGWLGAFDGSDFID
jgi:hypothetical protein